MTDFQTVARALVDADDRLRAGLADLAEAAVDADHPAVDLVVRSSRRVVDRLRPAGSDELVAGTNLLRDARQHDRRRLAAALKSCRAEVDRLIGERLVAVRIDQRHAAPEHIPAPFL